jgi:hypothetical protein
MWLCHRDGWYTGSISYTEAKKMPVQELYNLDKYGYETYIKLHPEPSE